MSLEKIASFMITQTRGFVSEIDEITRAKIIAYVMPRFTNKIDFIILDPAVTTNHVEDKGITLHSTNTWTKKKIYVKRDDFGDPKDWDEMYEPETVKTLREAPNCQFVYTFMLAEEY